MQSQRTQTTIPIPLDLLFLLLLVPAQMYTGGVSFLLVVPLLFYILLTLWHPLTSYLSLPEKFCKTRLAFLARFFLLLVIIATAVVYPALNNIFGRLSTQTSPSAYLDADINVHDGAVQVESALNFLSSKENPYVANYADTPLKYYGFSVIELPTNPAFEHFVYLPGLLTLSYPAYKLFAQLRFPYDQRWIYLAAYLVLVISLPLVVTQPTIKLSLLAGVALNPLLTQPLIIGMNDVMILLPIFLATWALSRKHVVFSAILLGLACTFKQSAWFVTPFYALYLISLFPHPVRFRELAKAVAIIVGIILVVVVPFIAWDPAAFFTDVFAYPAGNVAVNYPIRGHTIGTLLVAIGAISSPLDPFPFWILQLLGGLPLLVVLLKYQWQRNTAGSLLLCCGIYIFVFGFTSRFFQDNYVGFVIALILLGIIWNMAEGVMLEAKQSNSA